MLRLLLFTVLAASAVAQQPGPNQAPPRSDDAQNESSSRAPKPEMGDVQVVPPPSDINELRPFNPHKAAKSIEVGEFYLKRKNYKAARSRFEEALEFNPSDPVAMFRLAETLEQLKESAEALVNYEDYLKTAPSGPFAAAAKSAADRLRPQVEAANPGYADERRARKHYEAAQIMVQLRNYVNAAELLREAVRLRPEFPEAVFALAEATEQLGDFNQAVTLYRRYLALQPTGEQAARAHQSIEKLAPQLRSGATSPSSESRP